MKLSNKVALVTGGLKGIGRATVMELATQGADIALNYRANEKNKVLAEELVKELNSNIRSNKDITTTYDKILLITKILGLHYEFTTLTASDKTLYQNWLEAKKNKDFNTADTIREDLINRNII